VSVKLWVSCHESAVKAVYALREDFRSASEIVVGESSQNSEPTLAYCALLPQSFERFALTHQTHGRRRCCVVVASFLALVAASGDALAAASFDCVLYPALTVKVGSPVASIIESVDADRGDLVKKGQIVARLISSVEAANVALAEVKADDQSDIEASAAKVDFTKGDFEREETLQERRATSAKLHDQAKADFLIAQQQLASAELKHRLAQLELQRARAEFDQRIIRSPIDGVVTKRSLGPGEFVDQTAAVVTVAQIDPLNVETYLPIRYYGRIKVGDIAIVRPNDPIGGNLSAKVSVVDDVFDAASGTFGIRLNLPNSDHAVPGGLRCHVTFDVPELPDDSAPSLAGSSLTAEDLYRYPH